VLDRRARSTQTLYGFTLLEVTMFSDRVIQIGLYVIIFGNLFLVFLWLVFCLFAGARRSSLAKKLLWRDIAWLISGVIGWFIFSRRLLNNTGVFVVTFGLIAISTFIEMGYQRLAKPRANGAI
jgi:TctA family transporter